MRANTYQEWKKNNELKSKLDLIKQLASIGANVNKIADKLGICRRTFMSMKKKHKDIEEAYEDGMSMLEETAFETIVKLAFGFTYNEEDQHIVETARGTRKQIDKHVRYVKPDLSALKYMMVTKFGRQYSEKKYELELMEKRIEKGMEEWENADKILEDK